MEASREKRISDKKTSGEAAEEAATAHRVQTWMQPSNRGFFSHLGGLSPIQQRVFLAQLWRVAHAKPPRTMGSPSSLHSPNVTGAKSLALAVGKLRGARHKLLPVPLSSPPTARALTDNQGLFPKRHNFYLLFSSSHTAQRTSSVLV